MSTRAISGRRSRNIWIARAPSCASSTTYPQSSRRVRRANRLSGLSSTIRTRRASASDGSILPPPALRISINRAARQRHHGFLGENGTCVRAQRAINAGEMADERHGADLTPRPQLQVAALLALSALLFLPLQVYYLEPRALLKVVPFYGLAAALGGAVLVVTRTALGTRYARPLSLVFVLALASDLLVYVYLEPYVTPTYPAIVANLLTCLLIGSAVLFAWSPWRTVLAGTLMCAGFALVGAIVSSHGLPAAPFGLAAGALVAGVVTAAASARVIDRFRTSLAHRQDELAALSTRLMSVHADERRRVSRELHEELGSSLTAILSYLWLFDRQRPEDFGALQSRAADARRLVAKTIAEMRELSQGLRPSALDDYGLLPSLDSQVKTFTERHGIVATFTADGVPERLPADIETAVYRITQEALTNVVRHAGARRVRVALSAVDEALRLEVEDDGVGIVTKPKNGDAGPGPIGLRERAPAH